MIWPRYCWKIAHFALNNNHSLFFPTKTCYGEILYFTQRRADRGEQTTDINACSTEKTESSSTRCRVGFVLLCLIFCVIFYIFFWSLYCLSYISWFLSTFLIAFANGEKEREITKNNCDRRGQFAKASMAALSYKYNHRRVDNRGAHHWHLYHLKNLGNHELCMTRTPGRTWVLRKSKQLSLHMWHKAHNSENMILSFQCYMH
jgi:hypothetical protein